VHCFFVLPLRWDHFLPGSRVHQNRRPVEESTATDYQKLIQAVNEYIIRRPAGKGNHEQISGCLEQI
jgi:hypothetical protein